MTKQVWLRITVLFLLWRIALFGVGIWAQHLLPYEPSFPYARLVLNQFDLPQWLFSWANFDGVHYITIVRLGYYGIGLVQAFFPFYPMVVNVVNQLFQSPIISGLIVSNFFFYLLLLLWYQFVTVKYNAGVAGRSTLILALFPTSFFFGAMYTESLFLFLVIGSFYAAEKQRWPIAIGCAILASATRLVGIFLIPALFLELLRQQYHQYWQPFKKLCRHFSVERFKKLTHRIITWNFIGKVFAICLSGIGLFLYMTYLWLTFHDPLYFYHVQHDFNVGRSESIIFYPQVIWRYIKILETYRPISFHYFSYIQDFMVGTVGFVGIIWAAEYVTLSSVIFSLFSLLLPTFTGTFTSLPRYILVCFPLYIWLAKKLEHRPIWFWLYLSISTILLIFNTILFIQGYWVA